MCHQSLRIFDISWFYDIHLIALRKSLGKYMSSGIKMSLVPSLRICLYIRQLFVVRTFHLMVES